MPPLLTQPPTPPLHNHDLIMEILSWVPTKSLMRLKCVCKLWNSVISEPTFTKLQFRRAQKNTDFMLVLPQKGAISAYISTVSTFIKNSSSSFSAPEGRFSLNGKYCLLGSFNGLIGLLQVLHDFDEKRLVYWVRVWNPVISNKSKKSPPLVVKGNGNKTILTQFGFGYDELSDTYKVVALHSDENSTEVIQRVKVEVYNIGKSHWREIQNFPAYPTIMGNWGKFVGGSLNWVAIHNMSGVQTWKTITRDQLVIISLDMASETYKQFLLPNGIDEVPRVPPTLEVYRDCLYLFHDDKNSHFVVWQMKEFGVETSWTQFVRVSYWDLQVWEEIGLHHVQFFDLIPMCISQSDDIIMLKNTDNSEAILYDRRDNNIISSGIFKFTSYTNSMEYVETLILPC